MPAKAPESRAEVKGVELDALEEDMAVEVKLGAKRPWIVEKGYELCANDGRPEPS